jgi:hypothetical protein
MTRRVDMGRVLELCRSSPDRLTPGHAVELVAALGGLARWWLCDAALARAAEEYPQLAPRLEDGPCLPTAPGSCWVVYANQDPSAWPLLRPAFLLPLRWSEGQPHSSQLPRPLADLAGRVARSLGLPTWGLHLSEQDGIDRLDLVGVAFDSESGWAPLAGGLILAGEGARPRPEVWATGRWDRWGGVAAVGGLEAKLRLAAAWGVREFFVPAEQAGAAAQVLGGQACRVSPLASGLRSPREALRDYLASLDAPPDEAAPLAARRDYYLRQPPHLPRTQGYYATHLLPEVAGRLRAQARAWAAWSPTHLVTVVSGSPELVLLGARAVGARRCLLLHTAEFAAEAERLAALLGGGGVEAVPGLFADDDGMLPTMRGLVGAFAAGVADGDLVFDLTPGTKLMTLTLERVARQDRPRSWLVYVRHDFDKARRKNVPGTERLERWPAGTAPPPEAPA